MISKAAIFLGLVLFSSSASARVFSMKEGAGAGYFNATYGNSSVKDKFFSGESTATDYTKGFKTHMGGDFGFLYHTGYVSWLFGLEIVKPSKTKGVASIGATKKYDYTSDISVYIPKVGLEVVFYETTEFRVASSFSVGTGNINTKTDYANLTIAPNTDFSIEGKGTANLMNYTLGCEWYWTDNTTILLTGGYRQLNFKKIEYLKDVASSFDGAAHTKGSRIKKVDGSNLGYDFTNYYLSVGLRFWLF